MGLFDTVLRAATGAEKEGLTVLREILGELRGAGLGEDGKAGAIRTVQAVIGALKRRKILSKDTEAEAQRELEAYRNEGRTA